jgi:hypothetical protein
MPDFAMQLTTDKVAKSTFAFKQCTTEAEKPSLEAGTVRGPFCIRPRALELLQSEKPMPHRFKHGAHQERTLSLPFEELCRTYGHPPDQPA